MSAYSIRHQSICFLYARAAQRKADLAYKVSFFVWMRHHTRFQWRNFSLEPSLTAYKVSFFVWTRHHTRFQWRNFSLGPSLTRNKMKNRPNATMLRLESITATGVIQRNRPMLTGQSLFCVVQQQDSVLMLDRLKDPLYRVFDRLMFLSLLP